MGQTYLLVTLVLYGVAGVTEMVEASGVLP